MTLLGAEQTTSLLVVMISDYGFGAARSSHTKATEEVTPENKLNWTIAS